jgi:hypothetical protein
VLWERTLRQDINRIPLRATDLIMLAVHLPCRANIKSYDNTGNYESTGTEKNNTVPDDPKQGLDDLLPFEEQGIIFFDILRLGPWIR